MMINLRAVTSPHKKSRSSPYERQQKKCGGGARRCPQLEPGHVLPVPDSLRRSRQIYNRAGRLLRQLGKVESLLAGRAQRDVLFYIHLHGGNLVAAVWTDDFHPPSGTASSTSSTGIFSRIG